MVEVHTIVKTGLTLCQFAAEVPKWYQSYSASQHFQTYKNLEARLSQKALTTGYLDKRDLMEIAEWGSDQKRHGLGTLICTNNTDNEVTRATEEAIKHIANPRDALLDLFSINYMKLSYASKTLRCVCPRSYPACDVHTRRACEDLGLNTDDNDAESLVAGYLWFVEICRRIMERVKQQGPRPEGAWFIADIEMALFQFARSAKGRLVAC